MQHGTRQHERNFLSQPRRVHNCLKSADNLTSFLKKLRDHRGSRGSRQEWRLVFLAPVALPYGEVKNLARGTCVTRKEIIMILAIIVLFLLGYPAW